MNAPLPPDDERRQESEKSQQAVPKQAVSGPGLGFMLALMAIVGIGVFLLLPAIQNSRPPAQRSVQAEMEQRQQAIEHAAREAQDEAGLANNR